MPKIEKQAIPIFFNGEKEPVAALLFIKGQRVIYTLSAASEDEIVSLYEKTDSPIKEENKQTNPCGNAQNAEKK